MNNEEVNVISKNFTLKGEHVDDEAGPQFLGGWRTQPRLQSVRKSTIPKLTGGQIYGEKSGQRGPRRGGLKKSDIKENVTLQLLRMEKRVIREAKEGEGARCKR